MPRRALMAALGCCATFAAGVFWTDAETYADSPSNARGNQGETQEIPVPIFDPTKQSPPEMMWRPYPAPPPAGFHWQHTGTPAIKLDPATRQPLPGQPLGGWVLVRDGYSMPKVR